MLLILIGLAALMFVLIIEPVRIWSRFVDAWFTHDRCGQGVMSISPEIPPPRRMRGKMRLMVKSEYN